MRVKYLLFTFVLAMFFVSPNVFAGNAESVKTMANIMMHLNHFPSGAEKQQLDNIVESTDSEDVRTVARAIFNLQHSASDVDKEKLQAVLDNPKAEKDIKTLATIVFNLNHKPTSADKQQLSSMMSFAGN